MITILSPDGHVTAKVVCPLTEEKATDLESQLAQRFGVMVRPVIDAFGTVHLHPDAPLATDQEVAVLRLFTAVSDSPLAWHDDSSWTVQR